MNAKTQLRATASVVALLLGAAPAFGQVAPVDPAARTPATEALDTAQGTPVDATDPVGDEAVSEDIVVTGFRESLASSRNLKRNAPQQVDAIVAEDIGKLPDIAVSDTAARIPGVQVLRLGGEASQVLIRGLPEAFFTTLYNGREIFTAERRDVALQDFPAAGIAALEVFKTSTANLVEPGIAGQTNVRSRRPFDFSGFEASGTVYGLHTAQAGKVTPNGSFLISNRWETGIGDIGLLVNGSYTELDYLDSEPSNTDFVADPEINGQRVRFPDIQRLFYRAGNRSRPSGNVALQWRPDDKFEFYIDGLYQGFRNRIANREINAPLFSGQQYSNLVFREGTNVLESGTVTNPGDPIFSFQGGTFNKTDTYQVAVGGIYDSGPLRITADLARTKTKFTGSTESVDRTFRGPYTVNFDIGTPQFDYGDYNFADPANSFFDGLYEEAQVSEGDDYQARVDAEYKFEDFFIRSFQLGARYTTRDGHREFGNRFAGYRPQAIPISALPLDFRSVPAGFRGTNVQSGFRTFLAPTYDSIRDNRAELRRFVIANPASSGFGTFTEDAPAPNPTDGFDADERTIAGYAQANFAFGDVVDGTVGIRGVQTKVDVSGVLAGDGQFVPTTQGQKFTDWLPNASLRIRFTPELQLRLTAAQTRTRPTFTQLNPSASLGPPGTSTGSGDPFVNARRGNAGNPLLRPFTSNSYDASLEWYFSRTGFIAAAVFRRDTEGFVQNQESRFIDPTLGPIIFTVPVNSGEGRIDGAEAQLSTFFDFDFLPDFIRSFGIQANYTYLDAKTGFPDAAGNFSLQRILGVSKHTYNIVGLFERGPFSTRVTWNKRGRYSDQRVDRGDDLYLQEARPAGRLDFSSNLTINENATIFFDATNLLGDPFRIDFSSARAGAPRAEFVRFLRFDEQTFSLGLRFRI